MNDFKPEAVIFHYPNPFVAHSLIKFFKRDFKLVLYWHLDIIKQKFLKKFFGGQNLKLLRRADKIIATSPNYLEHSEYLPRFKEKCAIVPSCVNLTRLQVTEEIKESAGRIRELNAGKIILGMEYLVRASKYLDGRFKIYIGGAGPLTESLKTLAAGDNKIEFLGKIPDDALIAHMLACDIYCFPSVTKNEAFGLSLAEAMYFSKPAVTFTIEGSGVNYVNLNGITGLEVENGNSEKYAEAIKLLADDPVMRENMGKAAKIRVENNFLYGAFAEKIKQEIQSL